MNVKTGKRRQQFLVGYKIRELRKARSLTQAELAGKIGIQQSDLCRMETGEYKVSLDTLFRVLGIFGGLDGWHDPIVDRHRHLGKGCWPHFDSALILNDSRKPA